MYIFRFSIDPVFYTFRGARLGRVNKYSDASSILYEEERCFLTEMFFKSLTI